MPNYNIGGVTIPAFESVEAQRSRNINEIDLDNFSTNHLFLEEVEPISLSINFALVKSIHPSNLDVEKQRENVKQLAGSSYETTSFDYQEYNGFLSIDSVSVPQSGDANIRRGTIKATFIPRLPPSGSVPGVASLEGSANIESISSATTIIAGVASLEGSANIEPIGTAITVVPGVASLEGSANIESIGTVTTPASLTIDDFESYSTGSVPSPYTAVNTNSNAGVVTTSANSGSQSLNIQGPTGLNGFDPTITKTFSAVTPDTIQVTYYETNDPSGGAIRWLDSSGEELCAVGSGNPQVQAVYGNNSYVLMESSPSPDYETWRRFTVTPDFGNGSFDVLWEDIGGSTGDRSQTGLAFVGSPSDVAEIQFGGDKRPSAAMGANGIGGTFLVDDSSSLV
jgi:hypothetical protein